MSAKHIKRDFSEHRRNIKRPYDEYWGLEIFSYTHKYTQYYIPEDGTLKKGTNAKKTSWKSWTCYKSDNKTKDMEFKIRYNVKESGDYRIDLIYEQSNHIFNDKTVDTGKDLVGNITITTKTNTVLDVDKRFDGENNIIKRITLFKHLNKGVHTVDVTVPNNCYFMGCIIRKIRKYTGNNYHGINIGKDSGLLTVKSATLTISEMTKPSELVCEVAYDDAFECRDSPSGFFMDYNDEVNFYVRDSDGDIKRVFGGYLSSILPDDNRTKLTIHCADRLVDGVDKYVLDEMKLLGGTKVTSEDEYREGMSKNFKSYAQSLKYLCDIHEVTLKSNISKNYLVNGEKYSKGFTITFGKKKRVKKIKVSNGYSTPSNNFIMIRNKPSSSKPQVWTLYNAKDHAKTPPAIYQKTGNRKINNGYLHITYGLGGTKTTHESKITEKIDVSDTKAGVQKFTKCGVSQDKKYVMFIGVASVNETYKKYGNSIMKRIYKNECPYCHQKGTLRWDDSHGNKCIHGRNKSGVTEGEITCINCDCDFDGVGGREKINGSKRKLTPVTNPVRSSVAERDKLSSGKLTAIPTTNVELTPDSIFKAITNVAFKYNYKLGGSGQTYSQMKKTGYGDCHGFSDLIFHELKNYGVSCKIVQYATAYASNHRSVLYLNEKGKWVDFPYRQYGWNTKYHNMLNNTSGSKNGSTINYFKGSNIGTVKVKSKTTTKSQTTKITTTKGYDKSKPFQGYLKITYSNTKSFKAKKKAIYLKFTQDITVKNALNNSFDLYWINNQTKQATVKTDLVEFIHKINNSDEEIYLQSIQMIAPKRKASKPNEDVDWYKYDKTNHDESSCKMNIYQITFNNNDEGNPYEFNSCGKSVNSMMKEIVEETGYYVNMSYGLHRKDDIIHFRVNNSSKESFTATEGDNNNILSWNSISYSPLSSLFNMSMQVFKTTSGKYYYVDTRAPKSILRYGEKCTLQTSNNPISPSEAYFNAKMNPKFNPAQTYNFTITVAGVPDVKLGDFVKVLANAKKLNTVKEIQSLKIKISDSNLPRVQTEMGLGELAPDIQVTKNIQALRRNAKKETTSFTGSAIPITDEDIFEWG